MSSESVPMNRKTKQSKHAMPRLRRASEWPIMAVLGTALTGLWAARDLAAWSNDPSTPDVAIWSGSLAAASLATLIVAMSSVLSSSQSRLRHVFCGRRTLLFAATFLVIGVAQAASMLRRSLFGHFFSQGQITATEIADVGLVLAAIACLTGAGIAFIAAWEAYREERSWHISLWADLR